MLSLLRSQITLNFIVDRFIDFWWQSVTIKIQFIFELINAFSYFVFIGNSNLICFHFIQKNDSLFWKQFKSCLFWALGSQPKEPKLCLEKRFSRHCMQLCKTLSHRTQNEKKNNLIYIFRYNSQLYGLWAVIAFN